MLIYISTPPYAFMAQCRGTSLPFTLPLLLAVTARAEPGTYEKLARTLKYKSNKECSNSQSSVDGGRPTPEL
jgi:hypothetical protein